MAKEKPKRSAEETIRTIRRVTRKKYTADDKIRIVLEGLRGGSGIRELCRREGIATNLYYSGSKEFLEAGKQRLLGDTQRQATSREVSECAPKSINSSTWWRSCRSRTACSTLRWRAVTGKNLRGQD